MKGLLTMVGTYIEENTYKSLSNKELIEKQKQIDNKLSIAYSMGINNNDLLQSLNTISEMINNEIMKRLEEGTMDDEEFDDDF